jgi:RimJ/RimL family protein N-acetyltransferase
MQNKYFPFIQGERIFLREVRISDVNENYYNWMNDRSVNQFLETRFIPQSMSSIEEYVEKMNGKTDEIFLAICDNITSEHIGNIKVGPINQIHKFADISLLIGNKNFWRKGIATEAISLIVDYSFNVLCLHKLKAGCYEKNIASATAFEKNGFKREGLIKNLWYHNGEFQDQILLGLCIEDYI